MINLRVIRLKDIVKYLGVLFITITIVIALIKIVFKNDNINIENELEKVEDVQMNILNKYTFLSSLKIGSPILNDENLQGNEAQKKVEVTTRSSDVLKRVINVELAMLDNLSETKEVKKDNKKEAVGKEEKEDVELAKKEVKVEKVEERNIEPTYTLEYEGVKIKNQSSYKLTDEILKPDYLPKNCNDILIFHTHTCESYTESEKYKYKMTGNYRTTDINFSVARVGKELKKQLEEYNFNVIHNTTLHDHPSYNGSYDKSLETVESILKKDKTIDIVIDLHRDAVGNGEDYGPTVKIDGESVAQLMIVIGTDGGGLWHPDWKKNLKTAMSIQKKGEELYPGLFRPMIVRDSRYNQQVRDGAFIIEVGATANTLDESLASMKYLALVLEEAFK